MLVYAELTSCFVAMSVVAWLRYPVEPRDYLGRFLFPVGAAAMCLLAVRGIRQPVEPVQLWWVLGLGVAVVGTADWALAEVRC